MFTALNVVDPMVARSSSQYLTQRVLATTCNSAQWIEVGWGEFGWLDDQQYMYTYSTKDNTYHFYNYPIQPGQRVYVELYKEWYHSPVDWQALIWWNGGWQQLDTLPLVAAPGGAAPSLDCGEDFVEVQAQSGRHFTFPPITVGDGGSQGLQVETNPQGTFRTWDTTIPTLMYDTADSGFFTGAWGAGQRYFYGQVTSNNRPPVVQLSVSPSQGSVATTFNASVAASDPDGDGISSYAIDWGDGTITPGASGSHRYNGPGSYVVRGTAADVWGDGASDTKQIEVCVIDAQGRCVTGSEAPRPCGDVVSCPEEPEVVPEPCAVGACLPAPAVPEPVSSITDPITEGASALPIGQDSDSVNPADRVAERVLPESSSGKPCGGDKGYFVGTAQPEGDNVRAVKATITAGRPKLCENDGNAHNAVLVWTMLTNGGWAQSGYMRATERSGVRFFSQEIKCFNTEGCNADTETKITPIPGVDIDTFLKGETHIYKQVWSDNSKTIKMMVDDVVLDETNFNPKKAWGEPWRPEWVGEAFREGDNVPGTKRNPVYFHTMRIRRGCQNCDWIEPEHQFLSSSIPRYHYAWDNEQTKFHIWTED